MPPETLSVIVKCLSRFSLSIRTRLDARLPNADDMEYIAHDESQKNLKFPKNFQFKGFRRDPA